MTPDDAVTERIPPVARKEPSLGRSSGLMAVANLVSRITGFLRQVALFTVLGDTVLNSSYIVSNTLPNIVYELLLGGVLTSMMIPLLVRAQTEDRDGGAAYTNKLLTVTATALLLATALALLAAPLLIRLYLGSQSIGSADLSVATTLSYLLLPQIFFYGVSGLLGAILNTRGAFGAFAWAPVLNNVVVLAVAAVYFVVPVGAQLLVLGLGTTFGIVVQAGMMLPAMRRIGFRYRPTWGWDPRLTMASRQMLWVVAYVLIGQAGYVVTTRVAFASDGGAVAIYTNAWLLLQVPYGVLGVSLLTALMPRMSRAAAEGRTADVVSDLAIGGRLSAVFLVPVSVLLTLFGTSVGLALFGLRQANVDGAAQLGAALAVSAFGLLPYAITLLQLRVFYALNDTRTPTLIQVFTVAVKVALMLACPLVLPARDVVLGLAAANSMSFVAGAVLGQVLLRRRLGALPTGEVLAKVARTLLAAVLGFLPAYGLTVLLVTGPIADWPAQASAWTSLAVAMVVGTPLTLLALRVLGVRDLDPVVAGVTRRFRRRTV